MNQKHCPKTQNDNECLSRRLPSRIRHRFADSQISVNVYHLSMLEILHIDIAHDVRWNIHAI